MITSRCLCNAVNNTTYSAINNFFFHRDTLNRNAERTGNGQAPVSTRLNPEFLNALPENIQQEVIDQQRRVSISILDLKTEILINLSATQSIKCLK